MTLTAWNASLGVLQSFVTPKPDPSDQVFEPLAPAGIGAIPTLNLACCRALIRSHGPSSDMYALPERNWLAVEEDELALGICAATFSLLTRSVYHCAAACHSGVSTSSFPSALSADLPEALSTHGRSCPMSLCAQNPYLGGLVSVLASFMNSSVVQPIAGSFNPAALNASLL